MNATLVVMAAGMASRYGSLKQIDKFGPTGESIIEYSIHDAIEAGFTKVVFIIRKLFYREFKEIFDSKFSGKIIVVYAFQELEYHTENTFFPVERTKPWGTAHAVLCASQYVNEPFAVINADDFYGKDAFKKAYEFLITNRFSNHWANICFDVSHTLSDNGTVSRGICELDNQEFIVSIIERVNVFRIKDTIVWEENGTITPLSRDSKASMNFWCFYPETFEFIKEQFMNFLNKNNNNIKDEFFITLVADEFLKKGRGKIKAISTDSTWFGVTYKEDKPIVQNKIDNLIKQNIYPISLWKENVI